jgi:hypothetical protein
LFYPLIQEGYGNVSGKLQLIRFTSVTLLLHFCDDNSARISRAFVQKKESLGSFGAKALGVACQRYWRIDGYPGRRKMATESRPFSRLAGDE